MKTLNKILLLLIISTLVISCDDILEENITNEMVHVISPSEGTNVKGNTVQFNWEPLDGADEYRVQIMNNNQSLEVDSLINSKTNFSHILSSGHYQWRIRGENFAYTTPFTFPVKFSVETSEDLSNQSVALSTPSSNLYTNNTNFIFTWEMISTAKTYGFELIKNLNGEQTLIQQPELSSTNFKVEPDVFDEDAEYIWKVKAANETSETAYSQRSLFIDRVAPNQPALASPSDGGATTKTVSFNWANGADSGNVKSAITNTIQISSDIDFNNIINTSNTGNNTYQYVFINSGTYYWRVKATDAAANKSDFSIVRSILVE